MYISKWVSIQQLDSKKKGTVRVDCIACDALFFWGIISDDFLFYIDKVCCVNSLESPRWGDSN